MAYALNAQLLSQLSYYGYPKSVCQDSAMQMLDLAGEKAPKEWRPYMDRGILLLREFSEQDGLRNIHKANELNPNNFLGYDMLGKYYLRSKDYGKGIDYILKGATISGGDNDPTSQDEQMGYFFSNLDIDQSYAYFKRALESNPEKAAVLAALGNLSLYYGEFEDMLEYAKQYRKLRPDLVNAANMVAQSHLFLDQYELAEEKYLEMLQVSSDYVNEYMVFPFKHRLGYVKLMSGKEDEGLALLESYRDELKWLKIQKT